jgi:hypothetical protein
MAAMSIFGAPLNNDIAPNGIISFEFAFTPERAQEIIDSWDHDAQMRASFIQGLDFLYLMVYSTTIAIGCIWAGKIILSANWPLASAGTILAWGLWIAALCDTVENIALVVELFGTVVSPWPQIAAICAGIKFTLIFLGLVFVLFGVVVKFITTPSEKQPAT